MRPARVFAERLEPRTLLSAAYAVTDLGTLPGGGASTAVAINSSGQVAGTASASGGVNHAFFWTSAGGMQDLGTLGGPQSEAYSVNDSGEVVGGSDTSTGADPTEHAFVWTNSGGMIDLGTLAGDVTSQAQAVNGSGEIVGFSQDASDGLHAFIWTAGDGMQSLGTLPGFTNTVADAINDAGEVVGAASNPGGNEHAFIWSASAGMQDLGTLAGATDISTANAVNAGGHVTGTSFNGSNTPDLILWTSAGGMQDLGALAGFSGTGGLGINASDQIVGTAGSFASQGSPNHAVLWTTIDGNRDLNNLVGASAFTLNDASAINSSGQIAGDGTDAQNLSHALLLTPAPPTASASAPNITSAGASIEAITVTYSSLSSAIDTSTIGASNVTVTDSHGASLPITFAGMTTSGDTATAVYNAAAPGGSWTIADNGAYTVHVARNAVRDVNGNANPSASTTFSVAIPDTTAPTATISAPNITSPGATSETVTVVYADDVAVQFDTIANGNISVIGPGGTPLSVTGFSAVPSADAATITVTYAVAAPGGSWSPGDDGSYTVSLTGEVTDTSAHPATATPKTFDVNTNSVSPTPSVTAPNIVAATSSPETITVVYTDAESAINVSTINASDLTVMSSHGVALSVTLLGTSGSGGTVTAAYAAAAPGGSWDAGDDDSYSVLVGANAVKDANGHGNAATSSTFSVAIPDAIAPTATITANNVTSAGGSSETVTVVYVDNIAVKVATIGAGNIAVTGPGGTTLNVASFAVAPNSNAKTITATYKVTPPGGAWTAGGDGPYTVALTGQVTDTSGNVATAAPRTFTVDTHSASPVAAVTAPNIAAATFNPETITVLYTDSEAAINASTIGSLNVGAVGPGNASLSVSLASVSVNGQTARATYAIDAPGGSWQVTDDGVYTVTVNAGAVKDLNGNGNAAASATFNVAIPDTTAPTAVMKAADVTTAGGTSEIVTVVYADDVAVDPATIKIGNLKVGGPGNPSLTIKSVVSVPDALSRSITATYTVAAPGGGWTNSDDGTYTISLLARQVKDAAANAAAAVTQTFNVVIPGVSPTAQIAAPDITSAGAAQTVTVIYGDAVSAIDTTTIAASNLTVGGPNGIAPAVTLAGISGAGMSVTAAYSIAAPPGGWSVSNSGIYTMNISAGAVKDVKGDGNIASSATFTVSVGDTAAPVAVISAPPITKAGGPSEAVTIAYTDNVAVAANTVGVANISVIGPGGQALAVSSVSKSPDANAAALNATYTIDAPGGAWQQADNGTYRIMLNADQVADAAGNTAAASTATFTVDVTTASSPLAASISAPDITAVGAAVQTITVVYTDAATINAATLAASNLTVTSPQGVVLPITLAGVSGSGQSITAVYTAAAPGGAFDGSNMGTYAVTVVGASVTDQAGNVVATTTSSFSFNLIQDPAFGALSSAGAPTGNTTFAFAVEQIFQEPDGNILAVGFQGDFASGASQGVIERLTPSGALDSTFGVNGVVTTAQGEAFYGGFVEPSGQIVAVGAAGANFLISRFNADGSADTAFATGGEATVNFGSNSPAVAYGGAREPDGSIIVAGGANDLFAVARLTAAGDLDASFNSAGGDDPAYPAGGQETLDGASNGIVENVLVEGAGRIVGIGASGAAVTVFRLDADGGIDSAFAAAGFASIPQLSAQDSGGDVVPLDIALQPGGNILASGQAPAGGLAAVRLLSDGQLDATFGAGGVSAATFDAASDRGGAIAVNASTGQFLLAGTTGTAAATQTAVAVFNPDGSLDAAFAAAGQTTLPAPMPTSSIGAGSGSAATVEYPPISLDYPFAGYQADGGILIGARNSQLSVVRRLQPVSAGATSIGALGKKRLPAFTLPNGAIVTITCHGGAGTVSRIGNNLQLTLTGAPSLAIHTKGGANTLGLLDISVTGNLRSLVAPTATLSGTLSSTSGIGKLTFAAVSGVVISAGGIASLKAGSFSGSLSAAGVLGMVNLGATTGVIAAQQIKSFTAANLSDAMVLAGANLGTDGEFGGAADGFGPGLLLAMKITGSIAASFIGAGVSPGDGLLGDGDDTSAGAGSGIHAITVKGNVDAATRFESAVFPRLARLPQKTVPAADPRFIILQ
ncbi:MAG TPA: hypothetical protein VG326_12335 [Tepidisphaeraceae bacterium]|nr:hypothetical protein [Tepidisphaeraceae bacterium]